MNNISCNFKKYTNNKFLIKQQNQKNFMKVLKKMESRKWDLI